MDGNKRFILATGKILKFELPSVMERGHEYKVSVKVKGNGKYIFLTLLLINNITKEQQWWVDNNTLDLVKNGGKLELKNETYESTWYFPIFGDAKKNKYTAFLGMYQDTYDLPTVSRRLVAYKMKDFEVVEDSTKESDVTKMLGNPYDLMNGIQTYKNRKAAPFEQLLNEAKQEILFVSTSHEFVAKYHKKLIRELIMNSIKITVMVLSPTSKEIKNKEILFEIVNIRDLSKVINETLKELCILRSELGQLQDKLEIKTYDSNVKYSYIVIDPHSENAIMKIEELPGDNPENRKSYLAYKKDNNKFFQEHWNEIKRIIKVRDYGCRNDRKGK